MAKRRYVSDSFWSDMWIENLDPLEKYLYLYLITNQLVSVCWIYEIQTKRMAYETGIDKEMILKMLSRFQEEWKVYYNDWLLFIVNFVKNQSVTSTDDNLWKWIEREVKELWTEKLSKITQIEGAYKVVQGAYKDVPIPYFTLLYSTLPIGNAPKGASVSKRFTVPTLEQVRGYCESRNNSIEPEAFLAHYDAVGWVYGKDRKPVRDWKACVRTREQKRKEEQKAKEPQTMDQRVLLYEKMWHVPFRTKYWSEKATEVKIYSL